MRDTEQDKEAQAKGIAYRIVALARDSVTAELRFLARAAARLSPAVNDTLSLATDGRVLLFEPWFVFYLFRQGRGTVDRAYLHTLLHCIFCHFYVRGDIDRPLWDLACDVAVENVIHGLMLPAFASKNADAQQELLGELCEQGVRMTAEHLYRHFKDCALRPEDVRELHAPFRTDVHSLWYESDGPVDETVKAELMEEWREIAERLSNEPETAGALAQNLRALLPSGRRYTEFLRRFGTLSETMRLSEDEFDQGYYAFGLRHYGNIPLVEPLEYSDRRALRDLVIAIDTSGSVEGELVQSFLQHTYDILMTSSNFQNSFCVRIIQCDDRLREDVTLRTREEFARYAEHVTVKGLGATDFRPVFDLVGKAIGSGELSPDCALLYFTDGDGAYPEAAPEFDTAFIVFGDRGVGKLPAWARQVALTEEDILDGTI